MNDKLKGISIQYLPSAEELDTGKNLRAGKFLWPGFTHEYCFFSKPTFGGKYRYVTGLESEDVTEDRKEEVAEAKSLLEKYYGHGSLEPSNEVFWKERKVVLNKKNTFLNFDNPEDQLAYYAIKAGAIYEIASSYEQAVEAASPKRWYLVEPSQYADISAQGDKFINKAIAALEAIDEDGTYDDMFLVHKVLITSDRGSTKQTPKSALYKDLSDFIHGKIVKTDKRKTPKQFVETTKLLSKNKKQLFVTAYVKDANYFNFLTVNADGQFENIETRSKYGASIERAVAYLSNPANQSELENVSEKVERKWSE